MAPIDEMNVLQTFLLFFKRDVDSLYITCEINKFVQSFVCCFRSKILSRSQRYNVIKDAFMKNLIYIIII